jgi:hypothetical protein
MKVALLFSGQPRFVNSESYQTIQREFLDKYDCDCYCHCWYSTTESMATSPWSGLGDIRCVGNEIETIRELYRPVGFEYDEPLREEETRILKKEHTNQYNVVSMYRSLQRVDDVFRKYKPAHIQYDVCVRLRYDCLIWKMVDFYTLEPNCLYIQDQHIGRYDVLANHAFVVTGEELTHRMLNMIEFLPKVEEDGIKINDEEIIGHFVNTQKIPHKKIHMNQFSIHFVRNP